MEESKTIIYNEREIQSITEDQLQDLYNRVEERAKLHFSSNSLDVMDLCYDTGFNCHVEYRNGDREYAAISLEDAYTDLEVYKAKVKAQKDAKRKAYEEERKKEAAKEEAREREQLARLKAKYDKQ